MHHIHLTRAQRYELHKGNSVDAVGVQVPVWYSHGATTEPAREVFCKYYIHNDKKIDDKIMEYEWGYEFNLPQINKPHEVNKQELLPFSTDILDIKDGGKTRIGFNQKRKIYYHKFDLNILHYIRIEPIESLTESLV